MVRGLISATIASLIDLGFKPVSPTKWLTPDGTTLTNFDHEPGISYYRVLDYIQQLLEQEQTTCGGTSTSPAASCSTHSGSMPTATSATSETIALCVENKPASLGSGMNVLLECVCVLYMHPSL